MKTQLNFRLLFILGGVVSLAFLTIAYFLEVHYKLSPCPLCYLQRYILWIMIAIFSMGAIQNCKNIGRIIYSSGIIFVSTLGALLATRHLWLQYFISNTDSASNCMAGFEKMLKFKPLLEVLKEVLTSSQECTKIDFTLLNLSLSGWSLLGFVGLNCFGVLMIWLQIKRRI